MVYGAVHKLHVPLEFTNEFEDVSDICMVIIDIVLTTKLVPFFNVNIILRLQEAAMILLMMSLVIPWCSSGVHIACNKEGQELHVKDVECLSSVALGV